MREDGFDVINLFIKSDERDETIFVTPDIKHHQIPYFVRIVGGSFQFAPFGKFFSQSLCASTLRANDRIYV